MSEESVVHGIIEKRRLVDFAETFYSKATGMETPLVQEAKWHFDSDGIHASAVDASGAAMVVSDFAPRGFEHYESPGRATIGIDLEALIERLGPADKDALIEFDVNMETRKIELRYGQTKITRALIDTDSIRDEPDTPDIELPNSVTLDGEQFGHPVEVADMVSDTFTIEGQPDERQVVFRAEGDIDDTSVSYGDEDVIDASVSEAVGSIYSTTYVRSLAKPIPDDSEVTFWFGDDFPLRMSWESYDGALSVEQHLGPRIDTQ